MPLDRVRPKGCGVEEFTLAGEGWIPPEEYRAICARVPILCVDLLPVVAGERVGVVIRRDTYDGGRGLALVGGAVLIDEPLEDAVRRHLRATLGPQVRLAGPAAQVGVYQYARGKNLAGTHDPRKNAVSVTYVGEVHGAIAVAGEAHEVVTFPIDEPPSAAEFGFGHGTVVRDCLARVTTVAQ